MIRRRRRRLARPLRWGDLRDALWCSAGLHAVGLFALTLLILPRSSLVGFGPLDTTIGWAGDDTELVAPIDTTVEAPVEHEPDQSDDTVPIVEPTPERRTVVPVPREPASLEPSGWSELQGRRARAGGGSGELTITLGWDTGCDLDLHVRGPHGVHGYYRQRETAIGLLDIDCNARIPVDEPLENFFSARAIPGTYVIQVQRYRSRNGGQPVQFTVGVWVFGERRLFTGELDTEREITVATFRVAGSHVTWSGSR
ncbi:MAG: hypothetical protein KDA88_14880 [Planctomycetaceae bacterium]|nr:hypothetical protein [Planctomycetaceae bacterium]MCB9951825.1 hypothetical protein [Planctomycetaceae bacterium]